MFKGLPPTFDCQDTLQTDDAACPAPGTHFVGVTAVPGLPSPKGCTGGQSSPRAHNALAGRKLIAG